MPGARAAPPPAPPRHRLGKTNIAEAILSASFTQPPRHLQPFPAQLRFAPAGKATKPRQTGPKLAQCGVFRTPNCAKSCMVVSGAHPSLRKDRRFMVTNARPLGRNSGPSAANVKANLAKSQQRCWPGWNCFSNTGWPSKS